VSEWIIIIMSKQQYSPELVEQIRNNTFPHTELDLRVRSYLHLSLSLVVDIVLVRWPRSSFALS